MRLKPCDWGCRKWQRSLFWLQYGRVRQHLQACDLLLEQINTCAVPPGGRPVMDMPAGIMRKAGSSSSDSGRPFSEIPAHVIPESPFDVALDLGFSYSKSVPGKEPDSQVDAHCTQLDDPICCAELEALSWGTDGSSDDQVAGDAWIEGGCLNAPSMGSGSGNCDQDDDGQQAWRENVVELELDPDKRMEAGVSRHAGVGEDLDGTPGVSRRSVGCSPESAVAAKSVKRAPVNFISAASYYMEGPSKAAMLTDGNSTQRRTSFCRIEAFVIRSRSTRAVPVRDPGLSKTPAKSISR